MANLRDLIRFEQARAFLLPRWLDRLVSAGITSTDPKVARRQKVVNAAALATAFNLGSRVISLSFYGSEESLLAQVLSALLAVAALFTHRLHRFGQNVAAVAIVLIFAAGVSMATWLFGLQSQAQAYFVLAGLAWFLFGLDRWRLIFVIIFAFVVNVLTLLQFAPSQGAAVNPDAISAIAIQSFVNAIIINSAMLFYALLLLQRAESELERQSRRAEALVSVVLPSAVAERLRATPDRRIADRIEQASILFADLEGFSTAAHSEPPEKVVAYLDELVRGLDAMCEQHGAEKIKMMGDAYMAASGLRGEPGASAIAIGRLALAMLAFQESRPPLGTRRLRLRIGIHTGPAIAGVIGDTRIAYDLWGDAVNAASRMESYGVPGRIHVSAAFHDAAGEAFVFEERGNGDYKGVGRLRTYFLVAAR